MMSRLRAFRLVSVLVLLCLSVYGHAQAYTSIVVFGDSLSDTGNVAHLTTSKYTSAGRVPGPVADYTDGRFTDGTDTIPAAHSYFGVWIEQLAAMLPAKPPLKNSLDGGTNYAYGFGTTADGTSVFTFGPGNTFSVNVNNLGQQITDYLATNPVITSKTLFVVWGGANDLINATSPSDITAAAAREVTLVERLIRAGATDIIVPNLPPLGAIPRFNGSASASASATQAAAGFNQALAAQLVGLPAANPGVTLHLFSLDVFTLFNTVIGPPLAPGFVNVTASSQVQPLVNPDMYLFWDDLHPTTAGHHLLATTAASLLAPAIATTTTIAASSISVNLGASVGLTATVQSTSGVPTGIVSFFDGTTLLGTGTLASAGTNSATAAFTTSTLAAGTHAIMASYAGTTGFAASASLPLTVTVTAPALTSTLSPASVSVARGASGTSTVTLTPVGGYSGTATLACGTLPAHFSCTFSPASLTLSGSNTVQTSTLTVGTMASARLVSPLPTGSSDHGRLFLALLLLPCFGLGARPLLRGKRLGASKIGLPIGLAILAFGSLLGLSGCSGSNNNAPSGSYTVPITVTTGSNTTTLSLTVVVQ